MITHADLLARASEIAAFYGTDKPTSNNNNWHMSCPACHSEKGLHLTATDRLVFHCFACKSEMPKLLSLIVKDGFDPGIRALGSASPDKKKSHLEPNYVAHEQQPDWEAVSLFDQTKSKDPQPVTMAYRYENELGQLVFLALEAETRIPNEKKPGKFLKIRKPYTSAHNTITNTDVWYIGQLMSRGRPLYNLPKLVKEIDKPVLVVEGEGKAIIAQIQHPEYVVTTWSQGMSAWKATDLATLQNRKVTLWPDNSETSIKNFLSLAANIQPSPKIVFLVPLEDRPMDWDLADPVTDNMFSTELLLSQAIQLTPKDLKGTAPLGNIDEIINKYNEHLRILLIAGRTVTYDIKYKNSDSGSIIPYVFYNTRYDLQMHYSKKIELDDKRKNKPLFEVDVWADSDDKIRCYGIDYDPTQEIELLKQFDGSLRLNRFLGYDNKPIAGPKNTYECFIEHIYHIMDKVSADYLLNWLRQMVQEPYKKPGVMVVLTGRPLSGKTIIGAIMQYIMGRNNVVITDGKSFSDGNTADVSGKILGVINEFKHDKVDEQWLKTAITDDRVTFVDKYVKKFTERSCLRLMGTTNQPIVLGADDRRIFPIQVINSSINNVDRQDPGNLNYYKRLDKLKFNPEGLSALHYYLKTSLIDVNIMAAPRTEYRQNIMKPEDTVQQIMYDIAYHGCLPSDMNLYVRPASQSGKNTGDWTTPFHSQYPQFIKKQWLIDLAKTRNKNYLSPTTISNEFSKYIEIEKYGKNYSMAFTLKDKNSSVERFEERGMVFELPTLDILRTRYNKFADQPVTWPELESNIVLFKQTDEKVKDNVAIKEDII